MYVPEIRKEYLRAQEMLHHKIQEAWLDGKTLTIEQESLIIMNAMQAQEKAKNDPHKDFAP